MKLRKSSVGWTIFPAQSNYSFSFQLRVFARFSSTKQIFTTTFVTQLSPCCSNLFLFLLLPAVISVSD